METGEVFSIDLWKIFFMLINLLLIYLILKRFLYKPVKKMFEMREREVAETYQNADATKVEAHQLKERYEEKLSGAKLEAEEIVRSATKRAQLRSESIIGEAKDAAGNMMERAQEQIEAEKKKAVNQIKDEIADIALMAASDLLQKEMDSDDHKKLIDQFIDTVGDESWRS